MTGAKFDIKKFNRTGDFGLWRIKMRALLIQHGCEAALEVLPMDMEAQTKAELKKKAHSASLANKLCLKKKLYTFYMLAGRKISEHIDEFNKIVLDLANIEEALTLKDVIATLNSKEIKERSKAKGDDGERLYVRGRTDRRDSRLSRGKFILKSRGGRLKCYICQSEDHLKKNCPKNNRKKSTGSAILDHGFGMFIPHDTQVWHKRLGHIREAGLQVLEKQGLFGKKSLGGYGFISSGSNMKHLESSKSGSKLSWIRSPLIAIKKKTPMEMWSGYPRYPEGVKGYRLYRFDDESPKIVTGRNVVFNESVMYKDMLKDSSARVDKSVEELQVEVELQRLNNHTPEKDQTDQEDGVDEDAGDQETYQPPDLTDYQLVWDREPKTRMKPLRFRDESNMAAYAFVATEEEDTHKPLTYEEAVACEDSSKWKAAMKEEMDSLRKNKT
ncbi:retrovirus-related pol polyprotein from transposon TNT 1-94 [Tanacetum coccineum]